MYDLDPDTRAGRSMAVLRWPSYDLSTPKDANVTSYIEDDIFKAAGIRLIE